MGDKRRLVCAALGYLDSINLADPSTRLMEPMSVFPLHRPRDDSCSSSAMYLVGVQWLAESGDAGILTRPKLPATAVTITMTRRTFAHDMRHD